MFQYKHLFFPNFELKDFPEYTVAGMQQAGGPRGPRPPQILADQKEPPGSGGAPHYYRPPRIFDPCCIPGKADFLNFTLFYSHTNLLLEGMGKHMLFAFGLLSL